METSAFAVAAFYAIWSLKTSKPECAVLNYYNAFKAAFILRHKFDADNENALPDSNLSKLVTAGS